MKVSRIALLALLAAGWAHAAEDAGYCGLVSAGNLCHDSGGVPIGDVFGNNVIDASVAGTTLTLMVQRADGCRAPTHQCEVDTIRFAAVAGAADGHLADARYDPDRKELTFTLSDGSNVGPVALTNLRTAAEVTAAINAEIGDFVTLAQVDARIAPYARATPSGTIADPQIPAAIARDSEVAAAVAGITPGLSQAQVDARIAPYARATPSGTIGDPQIPGEIARDAETIQAVDDATFNAGPTEADYNAQRFVRHEREVWVAEIDSEHSSGRAVSFITYTNPFFRGIFSGTPSNPASTSLGDDFWFDTSACRWYEWNGSTRVRLHTSNPFFIDRCFETRAQAEAAITRVPEVVVYPNPSGQDRAHQVASITPGTIVYAWAPISTRVAADAPLGVDPDTGHVFLPDDSLAEAKLNADVRAKLNAPGNFIGQTDTPASYTGAARHEVRVNDAGTALVFVDESGQVHPVQQVSRLPTVTATAPQVVLLSHDYTEGARRDITVTVVREYRGEDSLVGYSSNADGSAFGSATTLSPMDELYGPGATTSNFAIDRVASDASREFVDSFDRIILNGTEYNLGVRFVHRGEYTRTIQNAPTGLSNASLTLNLRRPDDTFYFTDGTSVLHRAGFYELRGGAYHKLLSDGEFHVDGLGEPGLDPTGPAQLYIDDIARLWVSGDRTIETRNPPTNTDEVLRYEISGTNKVIGNLQDFGPLLAAGDGAFGLQPDGRFVQLQGTVSSQLELGISWEEAWQYIADNLDGSSTVRAFRDAVWMGVFPSRTEMLEDLVETLAGTAFAANRYYFALAGDRVIRHITGYTVGDVVRSDEFFWNGPYATVSDAVSIVEDHIIEFDGHGFPMFDPDHGGQVALNDAGLLYTSVSELVEYDADPSWTETEVSTVAEAATAWPYYRGAVPHGATLALDNNGYFGLTGRTWSYRISTERRTARDWEELVNLLQSLSDFQAMRTDPDAPENLIPPLGRRPSELLAGPNFVFDDDAAAARYLATLQHASTDTTPFIWFTGPRTDEDAWVLRLAQPDAFMPGSVQHHEVFHWTGPLNAQHDDVPLYTVRQADVGGTANAITLDTGFNIGGHRQGSIYIFEATAQNTGGVTVAVDGLPAVRVERSNGAGGSTALTGGEITSGDLILLLYDARFGLLHWVPGHMGLLSRLNEVADENLAPALRDEIAQGGEPIAGLRYVISEAATTADAPNDRFSGNVCQAHRDITVRQFSYWRGDDPSIIERGYGGGCLLLRRVSDTDFRTQSAMPLWDVRANDGSWNAATTIQVPSGVFTRFDLRAPGTGFHIERDAWFTCLSYYALPSGLTTVGHGIVGSSSQVQQDHADHSFNDDIITCNARAAQNRGDRFFDNANVFNNATHSIRQEIRYDSLPTQFRDGVVDRARCIGDNLVLERSEGLDDLSATGACATGSGGGGGGSFNGNLAGDLTVGGTATVVGDIHAESDVLIDDGEHLILGDGTDLTIAYDNADEDVEVRLGVDADRIVVYQGTGTTLQHALERDGDASHAGDLAVGGAITGATLNVGGVTVTGDLEAQNDIRLGDRDQVILGTDADTTFDFDDRTNEVEIRLGPSATAFAIYDGTGTVRRFRFSRDGTSTLGGNATVAGNVLPMTNGAGAVGTTARAWGSGRINVLAVGDDLTVADDATVNDDLAVSGDIVYKGTSQLSLRCITQTDYDALSTPDAETLYVVAATCP